MIIDTEDDSIKAYLARRARIENQLLEEKWPSEPRTVETTALPQWDRSIEVEGDDLPRVLLDERAEYTISGGIIDVVLRRDTATEQHVKLLEREAISYFSEGRHVKKGMAMPALLPPPRRDPTVSGQMKLAIDVALTLPHMLKTDKVVVIGSAAYDGVTGASYYLMAGRVAQVDLWDPQGPEQTETIEGTVFCHHRAMWPKGRLVKADVVFNDAYDKDAERAVVLPVEARVYSLKDVGEGVEYEILARHPTAWRYGQLSDTGEVRWVSHPRIAGRYVRKLGDCAACRELDYKCTSYTMTDYQMSIWRDQHAYKTQRGLTCVLSQHDRPLSQAIASTITWRTHATPLTVRRATRRDELNMIQLDEAMPRQYLTGYGFYCAKDQPWRFVEREEEKLGDAEWRDPPIRHNFKLPNKAICLEEIPYVRVTGGPGSLTHQETAATMTADGEFVPSKKVELRVWSALLVVDTYVYLLSVREAPGEVPSPRGYCYGPIVSPRSIGVWVAMRFGRKVSSGRTGQMLAMRSVLARRTGRYESLGAYSFLDTD